MKNINITLTIVAIFILSSFTNLAQAQDGFVVIVNKNVVEENLSKSNLRRIYFGFTTQWKNFEKVKPSYMGIPNDAFWNYISTEESKFKSYWTKRVFSGNGVSPVAHTTSESVISYVSNTGGAIGIIESSFANKIGDNCRVIKLEN